MVSATNRGITAGSVYRTGQFSSKGQKVRSNLLLLWRERTLHEGLPGQEESRNDQDVRSKRVWNFAADEERYEPTDDKNIKEVM